MWLNVTEAERALMTRMAGREGPWSRRELTIPAGVDPPTLDHTLELLRRHDVIVEDAGCVRCASELMRRWVVLQHGDSD